MFSKIIAATLLAVTVVNAQLPTCALDCVTQSLPAGGCTAITDIECVCGSQAFQAAAQQCLAACTAEEQAAARQLQETTCAGVTPSGSASEAIPTASSPVSSIASSVSEELSSFQQSASSVVASVTNSLSAKGSSLTNKATSAVNSGASSAPSNAASPMTFSFNGASLGVVAIGVVAGAALVL